MPSLTPLDLTLGAFYALRRFGFGSRIESLCHETIPAWVSDNAEGRWQVQLPPLEASNQARQLKIQGSNTIEFDDVLVGEVWVGVAGNQSDATSHAASFR